MNHLLDLIRRLCPTFDHPSIASLYLTSKLIIAYAQDGDYARTIRISAPLQKALYSYRDIIPTTLTDDRIELWCELCSVLYKTGLWQNHLSFFALVAPNTVFDWSPLFHFFPATDIGRCLVALCVIIRDTPPDSLIIDETFLQKKYRSSEAILKKIKMDYDAYVICWRSVHLFDLANSDHLPSTSIVQAVRFYHSNQLPMTDLLSDYAPLYLNEGLVSEKIAVRGARKYNRSSLVAESGKSETDLDLLNILTGLGQEKPTDVVRGLFYPPMRNDAGFECTFLLERFYKTTSPTERVVIVNPSPDMILYIMNNKLVCKDLIFLVADNTLAKLYCAQFNYRIFYPITSLPDLPGRFDSILITSRDLTIEPMLEVLNYGSSHVKITAFAPEVSLRTIYEKLDAKGLCIHSVLSIPTNATQSSPRRKVLLEANRTWPKGFFLLQKALCDNHHTLLSVKKCSSCIPHAWLNSQMTLADMRKAIQKHSSTNHPLDPMIVRFSPEIVFHLTVQHNRKERVSGRVYYRRILRSEDKHRKRGNRLTPVIEKGLRKRTEAEVIRAVENAALDDRIAPAVVEDILDFYSEILHELSLKTTWYCLRNKLQAKYTYKESLVLELFSSSNQDLASLPIGTSTPNDYDEAMASIFSDNPFIPKRYWNQINLILNTAREEGYIKQNPLSTHILTVSARLTKRQQEVRNALTKKNFEIEEEQRMVKDLLTNTNGHFEWMKSNPLVITVLMALLAVPNLREAVALLWMDLVPNATLGTYHLQLTRYLADDGTMRPLFDHIPELRRCVPLAPALARILLEYKAYLMEAYNLTEDQLALCPIIMENHSILGKSVNQAKHCSLESASKIIKQHIDKLNIPSNEIKLPDSDSDIVTDLNHYNGNILYTNLKCHLRHTCKFTEGELCYFLGSKAPDTFSAHYCAYDHPVLQHRMALKLNRWVCKLTEFDVSSVMPIHYEKDIVESDTLVFASNSPYLVNADITIIPYNSENSDLISVEISSRHGVDGTIVSIENKEVTRHE